MSEPAVYPKPGHSFGQLLNVTAAAQLFALGRNDSSIESRYLPAQCVIDAVEFFFEGVAGGPTTLTFSVWRDAAVQNGLLPNTTLALTFGAGGTFGYARWDLPTPAVVRALFGKNEVGTADGVPSYGRLSLDVGTATLVWVYVHWRQ